jgi:polar amino acid transport system permease protein
VAVIAVLTAMFAHMLVTNDRFNWSFMVDNMFGGPILRGVRTTLLLTVLSMVIGVALGIALGVMRLSDNPVLSWSAWVYTWFFRAVPRYVLLTVFGNLGFLYPELRIGLPFTDQLSDLLGVTVHGTVWGMDANDFFAGFRAALLGLALSEAAYMAEIVRAGVLAVDPGQLEAAQSLGMGRTLAMRRVVLPQAMRVIVPPTGNETIAMLKDTSLVIAVPVSSELFFQLQAIGARTFQSFPMLVAACIWYLALSSVLMVGQYFLERRFSRGFGPRTGGGEAGPAVPVLGAGLDH